MYPRLEGKEEKLPLSFTAMPDSGRPAAGLCLLLTHGSHTPGLSISRHEKDNSSIEVCIASYKQQNYESECTQID